MKITLLGLLLLSLPVVARPATVAPGTYVPIDPERAKAQYLVLGPKMVRFNVDDRKMVEVPVNVTLAPPAGSAITMTILDTIDASPRSGHYGMLSQPGPIPGTLWLEVRNTKRPQNEWRTWAARFQKPHSWDQSSLWVNSATLEKWKGLPTVTFADNAATMAFLEDFVDTLGTKPRRGAETELFTYLWKRGYNPIPSLEAMEEAVNKIGPEDPAMKVLMKRWMGR